MYAAWRERGVQRRALQRFTRKLTVGASETQGQGFVFRRAVDIECTSPQGSAVSYRKPEGPRFTAANGNNVPANRDATSRPVAKGRKGHMPGAAGVSAKK